MDLELDGKVALVTGASGRIGAAVAASLADEGCAVVASGRDRQALEAVTGAIERRHGAGRGAGLHADVTVPGAAARLVQQSVDRLGRLDILVNCAGEGGASDPLAASASRRALDTKYYGYLAMIEAAVPHLRAAGGGAVANIAGAGGIEPFDGFLPGGVANAAVLLATKVLGRVLGPDGIRVVAVSPALLGPDEPGPERVASIPLGRLATAVDVARAVAFLVSPAAGYVTGANLVIDGGQTRGLS